MNIRPKTVRRLVILLVACGLLAGSVATVLYFNTRGKERVSQADRIEGMDAFRNGNYPIALDKLKAYVGKHQDDYDAMYAYAVSRSRVETSDFKHITEAKPLFEQLHNQRPDDMQVSHTLLDLYEHGGYTAESVRIADEILTRDPHDVAALKAKSNALSRGGKYADALVAAQKLNEVSPMDVQGHIQTIELLRQLKTQPQDIVARYQALLKAHPDDARFEMLLGLSYFYAHDESNTLKWFRSSAHRTPPDAAFVQLLAGYFDQLKLFADSRDLLERAAAGGTNPEIQKILVQRLWQNGQYADVINRLKDLDAESATADADLVALKALSLYQLQKKTEGDAIVDALKRRPTDNKAAAWAIAITVRFDPSIAGHDAIQQYENALARDRENAVIRCWIGEAYLTLGETELATQQWRMAAEKTPSWGHPDVLLARASLAAGHTQEAVQFAKIAISLAPELVESHVIIVQAEFRSLLESPDDVLTKALIVEATNIQHALPGEPATLPILAKLQARSGKRDDAIATINTAIAPDRNPDPDLLLKLMDVSREQNLGLEQAIAARLPTDASASPRVALERALEFARDGKKPDGLAYLTKAAAGAKDQPVQWKVAQAQYLEMTGDPGAKDLWVALGDANPSDIVVQNLILKTARAAAADRDFYRRTIERVRTLTGDEAFGWKVANARYLLSSDNKQQDSGEAVSILTDLVRQSPSVPEYRVLLAQGLIALGNSKDAVDHLKQAVDLDPRDVGTMLDLARLLAGQGRVDDARGYLDRAAKTPALASKERQAIAVLLARQGATQQALDLLKPAADDLDSDGQLVLAELLRKRGAPNEAEAIYVTLLKSPVVSAEALASAADFYASTDRLDLAKQTMARLSDDRFSPSQRAELTGRFDEVYVSKDAAKDQYLAATTDAPNDSEAWQMLIQFYLRQNQYTQAADAADQGLKKLAGNEDLANLKAEALAMKSSQAGQTDLHPLIDALAKDPKNTPQVEMLRTIQDARENQLPAAQMIVKLRAVADKYPNYYPLQVQLIQTYVAMNRLDDAAAFVERAMQSRPNDADVAQLATGVYAGASRWRDMKHAAEQWRQRTLDHPINADIALASADLQLGDTKSAGDQLAPYLASVKATPKNNPALTEIVTRLLVMTDKSADARAILQPLLTVDAKWRRVWLRLGATEIKPIDAATDWINTAAATIDKQNAAEEFSLAQAWQQLGERLNDSAAAKNAIDLLKTIVDQKDASASAILMLAMLESDANEIAPAEALYRRVLAMQPDQPDSLNNLAFILLQRGGDLNEAKDLATKALATRPESAAFHDTLARIEAKLGTRELAIHNFEEAIRLQPDDINIRIGLAATLSADGQRDRATQELGRIDNQLKGAPPTNEMARQELQGLRDSLSRTTD